MAVLIAEKKSKSRLYLIEVQTGKGNKSSFCTPGWVCNDITLLQWLKDRMADKTIPMFESVQLIKNGIMTNVKL